MLEMIGWALAALSLSCLYGLAVARFMRVSR